MEENKMINDYISIIDNHIKTMMSKKYDINSIGFQATMMLLKFELGQYILNKCIGKNYKISEKGIKVCKTLYETIHKDITQKTKEFCTNPIEAGLLKQMTVHKIGERLYKQNYLGETNDK